tara:strand:+ start:6096 stop:7379 length:1284 start_codon:yes stop_codon:yes gene_type:complete
MAVFFDRPETGTHALLVNVVQDDESAQELTELATSAGLVPVSHLRAPRRVPNPRTFVGGGKLEEIRCESREYCAGIVLFDVELTPTQERSLEASLEIRVLSRTGLILEIFARRARTHEGQLQVELAQMQHLYSRLVRGWTHLDRQRGGSGRTGGAGMGVAGAGETQLEADQRMVRMRISKINSRLDRVQTQRKQSRRSRSRANVSTISLVGYTNAGKSTLFNRVCESDVHAADQLFATLDPTFRKLSLPVIGEAVLADTVGFIRRLPHDLVDAFRATLEEVCQADLLIHVVDASYPDYQQRIGEVNEVLRSIGADQVPQLLVFNKIDATPHSPRVDRESNGLPCRVWLSAQTGEGVDRLLGALTDRLAKGVVQGAVCLRPDEGHLRAALYDGGDVLREQTSDDGSINLQVRIEQHRLDSLGLSVSHS